MGGKQYDVSDVTTVKDVQEKIKKLSGNEDTHSVLFGNKKLSDSDVLRDAGVKEGGQLSMIPSTGESGKNAMEDYMKQAGMDPSKMSEMMKGLGGGDGANMKEGLEQMSSMMKSPMFQQFMSDPEQLEKSRKMILDNPMLKSMMTGMPGMEELLNDKDAWREAMTAAAEMYKNMDSDTLMKAMEQSTGAGGANPFAGGGGFDGTLGNSAAAAVLDELDEDD